VPSELPGILTISWQIRVELPHLRHARRAPGTCVTVFLFESSIDIAINSSFRRAAHGARAPSRIHTRLDALVRH